MAEGVVDSLEVIKVQVHKRGRMLETCELTQHSFEVVAQAASIRKACQVVREGQLFQSFRLLFNEGAQFFGLTQKNIGHPRGQQTRQQTGDITSR